MECEASPLCGDASGVCSVSRLIDAERRPIGVVTVNDVIRWLADLFPEAVLNRPPAGTLKHPHEIDAG